MAEIKYVAAGFAKDAEKLLQDFVKEDSMEFSAFAKVWKRHNFSLIYACRPNGRELREFTTEIFQLSINLLNTSSLLYQVGVTFLLYALHRNQILSPPLKIRMTSSHFKSILALAHTQNSPSLHIVISYLVENSFDCVAFLKLKGPNSIVRNEARKDGDVYQPKGQRSDMKSELTEIAQSNALPEIDELFILYERAVESLKKPFLGSSGKRPSFKDLTSRIDEFLNEGGDLDQDECEIPKDAKAQQKNVSAIGSRRALLKAAAFSHPACNYNSHSENNVTASCASDGIESGEKPPTTPAPVSVDHKKRRVRKRERKAGRPKKLAEDFVDEDQVDPNPNESFEERKVSGRRRRRRRGPQYQKIRYYVEEIAECDVLNLPSTSNYLSEEEQFSSLSDHSETAVKVENLLA